MKKLNKIERDIIMAGAPKAGKEENELLLKAATGEDGWRLDISPEADKQMKQLGITKEQLIQMIRSSPPSEHPK